MIKGLLVRTVVKYTLSVYTQRTGPETTKIYSCSTQLSMKFLLLVNVKMLTIVDILTFMSRKISIIGLYEP